MILTKTLYLMQGISGSGKSTIANAIANYFPLVSAILGSDDYWYHDGKYLFDPNKLHEAHLWNQIRVRKAMRDDIPVIIVDNTNTRQWEARPYLALAKDFGYDVQFIRVDCSPELAIARNQQRTEDRRVPEEVIQAQYARMEHLRPLEFLQETPSNT